MSQTAQLRALSVQSRMKQYIDRAECASDSPHFWDLEYQTRRNQDNFGSLIMNL